MAKKTTAPRSRARKQKAKDEAVTQAANIFDHLKLSHVRLTSLNSKLVIRGQVPSEYEITFQCSVGPAMSGNNVHANSSIEVVGKPQGDREAESTVEIAAQYQCVFRVEDIDIEAVFEFGEQIASVGAMISWPYLRELVQSVTGRMGLVPFSMPMLTRGEKGVVIASPLKAAAE